MLKSKCRCRLALMFFALALTALSCASPLTASPVSTGGPVGTDTVAVNSPPAHETQTETSTQTITPTPTSLPTATPSPVPLFYAKSVSAGFNFTCAVTLYGGAKCWGANNNGQLGNGTIMPSGVPFDVAGLTIGVGEISSGFDFACAVTIDGGAKCWGSNARDTLGSGSRSHDNSLVPVNVKGLSSGVLAISSGFFHACALLQTGAVKCWGDNSRGQLGYKAYRSSTPGDVIGLSSGVVAVEAGLPSNSLEHNCALMKTGGVKCWGDNRDGQLGNERPDYPTYQLVNVKGLSSGVSAISVGEGFSCALMESGGVKCWGNNEAGQLGDGTNINRSAPVDVMDLNGPVAAIAAGGRTICALMKTGGVKCWGRSLAQDENGQDNSNTPVDISGLKSGVSSITVGPFHACALMLDGGVKCWGADSNCELGNSVECKRTSYIYPPVDVIGPDRALTNPGATTEPTATSS